MDDPRSTRKYWAAIMSPIANSYDIVELEVEQSLYVLGSLLGDIHASFSHDLDGPRVQRLGYRSG
jgi:hypothetical protein